MEAKRALESERCQCIICQTRRCEMEAKRALESERQVTISEEEYENELTSTHETGKIEGVLKAAKYVMEQATFEFQKNGIGHDATLLRNISRKLTDMAEEMRNNPIIIVRQ